MNAARLPAGGPMLPAPGGRRRPRRRLLGTVVAGLVLAGLVAEHRPMLVGFARLFRVDDPAPADAIVVLLGGWVCRPLRAAELYRQGMAPVVLFSESDLYPEPDLCEAVLTRAVLVRSGVPAERIKVLPGESTSTRDEALRVRDYIRKHPVRRIIVVTTAFHTARARWIFRKVLRGTGVEVRMAAAEDPRFNESNWYTNRGLLFYLQEAPKRLFYQLAY